MSKLPKLEGFHEDIKIKEEEYDVLIMELLGPSLEDLLKLQKHQNLSLQKCRRISSKLVSIL